LPLVTDGSHQGWREWFRAAGLRGVHLPDMHTFSDSTDAMLAAAQGFGAILARSRIAEPYVRSGQLVRIAGPAIKARYGYFVVYPSHRRLTPAAESFVEWVRNEGTQQSNELPPVFKVPR